MIDIQKFIEHRKVEEFESFQFNYNSEFSQFNINENMVIFFDLEDNHIINEYITSNLKTIKHKFQDEYKSFVYLPSIEFSKNFDLILNYYLPYLPQNISSLLLMQNVFQKPESKNILNYFGYNGTVKCGLLFFEDFKAKIINCSDLTLEDTQQGFFTDLILYFKAKAEQVEFDDLPSNPTNPYENLDEDAVTKIKEIQKQLSELKQSGQLLFALPILKELLQNQVNTMDFDSENNLLIDEDFRIVLPNFNNIEIQLSHFTKVVYVLFYNNPQGLNIKQLHLYKQQIISLYAGISNQLDYDKMLQSVDDLISPESKAIYTHISRIKSAFYKQMDCKFADKFIVSSASFGSDFKFIPIIKNRKINLSETNKATEIIFDPNEFED